MTTKLKIKDQEEHFTDSPLSDEDREIGDHLAYFIGDTFITYMRHPPTAQWSAIVHALRFHGLRIIEENE